MKFYEVVLKEGISTPDLSPGMGIVGTTTNRNGNKVVVCTNCWGVESLIDDDIVDDVIINDLK